MNGKCLIAIVVAVVLATGCSTGTTGIYPSPVRLPQIVGVDIPEGTLSSGEEAVFGVSWLYGAEPFAVNWTFDGGTAANAVSSFAEGRADETSVLLVNNGTAARQYSGIVQIIDSRGNPVAASFTFTVEPAV